MPGGSSDLTKRKVNVIALCWVLLILSLYSSAGQSSIDSLGRPIRVASIHISGNTITKPYIIYRELLFKEGDSIISERAGAVFEKSRQNLLNTSLFNFVTLSTYEDQSGIHITISVVERWYLWPTPIFEITDRNLNSWWSSHDFTRVNYGVRLKWFNFRGRMENIDLFLRAGKNRQFSLVYELPYIEKSKRFGIGLEGGYIRKREVGFETQNNKLEYLFNEDFLYRQYYTAFRIGFRRSINTSHQLELRYQHIDFADSLLLHNPEFAYPSMKTSDYLSLYYKLKIDYRDAKYYPLSGWYLDAEVFKAGLGAGFERPVDVLWLRSTARFFLPLSKRWFFGSSIVGKVSSGSTQPYFLMQGLGYDRDFVRGYEYYVVDGNHYVLSRNNIKFAILPEKSSNLNFIPSQKFSRIHYASYLTLFADAGCTWIGNSAYGSSNTLPGKLLLGTGVGLDVVTYYDKVLRVEYSVNKLGESGIFIHFIAGI